MTETSRLRRLLGVRARPTRAVGAPDPNGLSTVAGPRIKDDEPTDQDMLGRASMARALANVSLTAGTPLVVGLYGRWGIGKTSLLRQIESELSKRNDVLTVRFEAWQHQFDDAPALALVHALVEKVGNDGEDVEALKRLLGSIAIGLGGWALGTVTPIDSGKVEKAFEAFRQRDRQIRDERTQLANKFREVVERARARRGVNRVVFLIDDLDRCLPEHVLPVLESLKLYLNLPGCVYFLGVDRAALEASVRKAYEKYDFDEVEYLDKIVQLPFHIPRIEQASMHAYIDSLLPDEFQACASLIEEGMSRNPRAIKRFINGLLLAHHLASDSTSDIDVVVLAALLFIQYRSLELYDAISADLTRLSALKDGTLAEIDGIPDDALNDAKDFPAAFFEIAFPDPALLQPYIDLTSLAGTQSRERPDGSDFLTVEEIRQLVSAYGLASGERLHSTLLLFSTRRQHTWLVATTRRLFCLLDDEKTRARDRVIQWSSPLEEVGRDSIRAYESTSSGRALVDIGPRKRWLYSRALHPDPSILETQIDRLVRSAIRDDSSASGSTNTK